MKCTPKVRQKTFGVHFKMIFETASFIDYIIQDFCLRNTTMLTANKISIIPTALFTVKSSLNTKTPITTAVNGSIAPKMEVGVGPAYLIACTKVILEIAVAGNASPRIISQVYPSDTS